MSLAMTSPLNAPVDTRQVVLPPSLSAYGLDSPQPTPGTPPTPGLDADQDVTMAVLPCPPPGGSPLKLPQPTGLQLPEQETILEYMSARAHAHTEMEVDPETKQEEEKKEEDEAQGYEDTRPSPRKRKRKRRPLPTQEEFMNLMSGPMPGRAKDVDWGQHISGALIRVVPPQCYGAYLYLVVKRGQPLGPVDAADFLDRVCRSPDCVTHARLVGCMTGKGRDVEVEYVRMEDGRRANLLDAPLYISGFVLERRSQADPTQDVCILPLAHERNSGTYLMPCYFNALGWSQGKIGTKEWEQAAQNCNHGRDVAPLVPWLQWMKYVTQSNKQQARLNDTRDELHQVDMLRVESGYTAAMLEGDLKQARREVSRYQRGRERTYDGRLYAELQVEEEEEEEEQSEAQVPPRRRRHKKRHKRHRVASDEEKPEAEEEVEVELDETPHLTAIREYVATQVGTLWQPVHQATTSETKLKALQRLLGFIEKYIAPLRALVPGPRQAELTRRINGINPTQMLGMLMVVHGLDTKFVHQVTWQERTLRESLQRMEQPAASSSSSAAPRLQLEF